MFLGGLIFCLGWLDWVGIGGIVIERFFIILGLVGVVFLTSCGSDEWEVADDDVAVLSDGELVEVGLGEAGVEVANGMVEVSAGEVAGEVVLDLGKVPNIYNQEIVAMGLMLQIERLAGLMGEVKGMDSARALEGEMISVVERINALNAAGKELGQPGEEEGGVLEGRYGSRTSGAGSLLQKNILALKGDAEVIRFVGKILEGIE